MMNLLVAYNFAPWHRCGYWFGHHFKYLCNVHTFDLGQTPEWGKFLGDYIPKGIPVSIKDVEKSCGVKFDAVVEIDGTGQRHLTGLDRPGLRTAIWGIDTHVREKREFLQSIADKFSVVLNAQPFWSLSSREILMPLAAMSDMKRTPFKDRKKGIIFIGNLNPKIYPDRLRSLLDLSRRSECAIEYTNGLYGESFINEMNKYAYGININLNADLNLRFFETMACGNLLLYDYSMGPNQSLPDWELSFGTHYVGIDSILRASLTAENKFAEIAEAGHKLVIEKHLMKHRARDIVKILECC